MLGKVIVHGAGPRGGPARAGRGARRDRDPRAHHQHRLPAGARRHRRVPRRRRSTPPGSTATRCRRPTRDARPRLRRLDRRRRHAMLTAGRRRHPFGPDGWRLGGPPAPHAGRARPRTSGLPAHRRPGRIVDDVRGPRAARRTRTTCVGWRSTGRRHARRAERSTGTTSRSSLARPPPRLRRGPTPSPTSTALVGDGTVTAPMPGTVLAVSSPRVQPVEDGARCSGSSRR